MSAIIARDEELLVLENLLCAKDAQLVALYGRRRIGKTHIIPEFYSDKGVYFEVVGSKDGGMADQLEIFADSLSETFFNNIGIQTPSNWKEAFQQLTQQLVNVDPKNKVILFFDELPWLATERSQLIQMIDHYWNTKWSRMPNLRIILCGSAASWMLDNLVNAKGGLHNRLSKSILLKPFNLKQTKAFLLANKIKLSNKQILDIYMVTGGVPYYLKQFKKSKSVAQNINAICFAEDGLLKNEFVRLFHALFDEADTNLFLVRTIAETRKGLSREMLIKKSKLPSGGTLTKRLDELEAAGFIKSYVPYGYVSREKYFSICDEYTLFYLKWIEPGDRSGHGFMPNHWQSILNSPSWKSWAGYAYESVCLKHIDQISRKLNLQGIACQIGSWRLFPKKGEVGDGAQIDLLFDRDDDAITICEIKYAAAQFVVDKAYAKNLLNKLDVFEQKAKTKKQLMLAMVTTFGVKRNIWSEDLIHQEVVLDDLFE